MQPFYRRLCSNLITVQPRMVFYGGISTYKRAISYTCGKLHPKDLIFPLVSFLRYSSS